MAKDKSTNRFASHDEAPRIDSEIDPSPAARLGDASAPRSIEVDRKHGVASRRLDELFGAASSGRFWGTVAVEITFENGEPRVVHHRLEGTDKP